MTATPIPRSLAMTLYADLDLSVIDELPPGRTPVTAVAVPDGRRLEVIERVRDTCTQGRQAYWVCTPHRRVRGPRRIPARTARGPGPRPLEGHRTRACDGGFCRREAGPAGSDDRD